MRPKACAKFDYGVYTIRLYCTTIQSNVACCSAQHASLAPPFVSVVCGYMRYHVRLRVRVLMPECGYNALINDEVNYAKLCKFALPPKTATQPLSKVVGLLWLCAEAIKMNDHRVNIQVHAWICWMLWSEQIVCEWSSVLLIDGILGTYRHRCSEMSYSLYIHFEATLQGYISTSFSSLFEYYHHVTETCSYLWSTIWYKRRIQVEEIMKTNYLVL